MVELNIEIPDDDLIDSIAIESILDLDDGECDLLLELVEDFVASFSNDLNEITNFIQASNYKAISATAHKLKGAGLNLGMKHFTKIASEIEQKGNASSINSPDKLITALRTSFDHTMTYFNNYFSERGLEFTL